MLETDFNFVSLLTTFLVGISTILLVYWYSTRNHGYWKKRGVTFIKPKPFLGNILDIFTKSVHDVELTRHKNYGNIYGHFEGNKALITVSDPDLLRGILLKDFFNFTARRAFLKTDEIFGNMVSVLEGEDWKRVRSIISPTFSTGKLKRVFNIFKDCSMTLVGNFKKAAEKKESIEVKRVYGAFTMDIIASSAFSVKIDSHNDPENKFVQYARNVFGQRFNWRFLIFFLAPKIAELFRIPIFPTDVLNFFKNTTLEVIEARKKSGKVGNDFLQLLMDTSKEVAQEEKWDVQEKDDEIASNYSEEKMAQQVFKTVKNKHLSMDELIAQCVIFFIAGYETSAATLAFATYLLALHQDVQDRLREEIDNSLAENKGELTYETLHGMKYLDNVISETLRVYPPATRLERRADTDYQLGDTGITIPKGMIVGASVYGLHMDPKYFPEPEKFDPDRFTPEERAKRSPYAYLPFGAGPRNCVGMRFALMEIKVCLALVVAHFKIKRSPKTKIPLEFLKGTGFLQSKEVIVDFESRPPPVFK